MMHTKRNRISRPALALTMMAAATFSGASIAQERGQDAQAPRALTDWSRNVWATAQNGRSQTTIDLLDAEAIPAGPVDGDALTLQAAARRLRENIARREAMRAEGLEEAHAELAIATEAGELLDGLRAAIEIDLLSRDGEAVTDDPIVRNMVESAVGRASAAEAEGDWLEAHGLYARLHLLFDEERTYREDLRRLAQRRAMLRFYTPEHLHELVNERRAELGEDPLPPFNALGEDWREKLDGITQMMVGQAIAASAARHVNGKKLNAILVGGYRSLRTFATTADLALAFPGLENDRDRAIFIEYLDEQIDDLQNRAARSALASVLKHLRNLSRINAQTIGIPEAALMHEFADGVMGELDDFSSIIWPGDMEQFTRTTSGTYKGVGIQISLNDASEIRVVTPLADTPAARAGVRPGDLIRKVNGHSTLGMGLLQAVDRITGDAGTPVTITFERPGQDEPIELELTREEIPIHSIRGWERIGPNELDWDWFIDEQNHIGYVRMSQFTNNTTLEFEGAVRDMKNHELRGLILDLRGNPGGLLSEAVGVMSLFINRGVVVTQEDNRGHRVGQEVVRGGSAELSDIPVVVLINGGSASASEIVAGALQDYGRAVIVGERSFGKGSVQHVLGLPPSAMFKLTTQYYRLPGTEDEPGRLIDKDRNGGVIDSGVRPDVEVEMLPEQFAEAFRVRQQGDVVEFDRRGQLVEREDVADVDRLVTEGLDPQLETALLLIRSQVMVPQAARARLD